MAAGLMRCRPSQRILEITWPSSRYRVTVSSIIRLSTPLDAVGIDRYLTPLSFEPYSQKLGCFFTAWVQRNLLQRAFCVIIPSGSAVLRELSKVTLNKYIQLDD